MSFLLCGIAYLIGGIPWCWLAVYFWARGPNGERLDLRKIGSGNVGASNAMEFLGLLWYLPLIAADASKSYLVIAIAKALSAPNDIVMTAAFLAVLGHCFPVYLRFKRGKGVSTAIGVLVGLHLFPELAVAFITFLAVTLLCKRPSAGILSATVAMSIAAAANQRSELWLIILIAGLIWVRFSDNLSRLLKRTEPPYKIKGLRRTG